MRISERLQTIADMVDKGNCAADIGTDHAFVPIELVRRGTVKRAIASDVGTGPIERAKAHVRVAEYTDVIDCRVGDGLKTLKPGEADAIVIAGMGGLLMCRILTEGADVLSGTEQLILSPHTEIPEVRRTAAELGFCIDREKMLSEDGKFYTVMHLKHGTADLSKEQLEFGPKLLETRPDAWLRWLKNEKRKLERIVKGLKKTGTEAALQACAEKEERLLLIDKILKNG